MQKKRENQQSVGNKHGNYQQEIDKPQKTNHEEGVQHNREEQGEDRNPAKSGV